MRTLACALLLLLAGPVAADEVVVRELTEASVELTFKSGGTPNVPASLTYRLVDNETGVELLGETTITPSAQPCDDAEPGCVEVVIPQARMLIVGLCKGTGIDRTAPVHCRTAADCPGFVPCRASTGAFQDHSLVLQWPDAFDEITLRTLNLPHVHAPTLTPSTTPTVTQTVTSTPTQTATATRTPTGS